MNTLTKALCWAGAILAIAVAGSFEVIDEDSVTTLLIVLPVSAWMALNGRSCCSFGRRETSRG